MRKKEFDDLFFVGIAGRNMAGKTTLAKYIKYIMPKDSVIYMSLDGPVKAIVDIIYPEILLNNLAADEAYPELLNRSPRLLYEMIRDNLFRTFPEDIWIDTLTKKLSYELKQKTVKPNTIIIIDDLKFPGDVAWIEDQNKSAVIYLAGVNNTAKGCIGVDPKEYTNFEKGIKKPQNHYYFINDFLNDISQLHKLAINFLSEENDKY
jgi:energy-coupling factor transporter ATP-binding protein EcfA2